MDFKGLRDFIEICQELGEVRVVKGAGWDLEIGCIHELTAEGRGPLLLFDEIPGYPPGFRVCSNAFSTLRRTALALGLPQNLTPRETLGAWRKKIKEVRPVPPVEVKKAPIKENVLTGKDIDVFKFPAPRWHERDGGRYIGTGDVVITRDPDEGWLNLGVYRVALLDKDTLSLFINVGQQGRTIIEKYHARGQSCPVAVCVGPDPILILAASYRIRWGESEYDFAGGLQNQSVEVTKGVATDLLLPARGEIVFEGEIPPTDVKSCAEGPMGEWTGYMCGRFEEETGIAYAIKVKSILHMKDPIILGARCLKPPTPWFFALDVRTATAIWDQLEAGGCRGIKGVWTHVFDTPTFTVIAIQQLYAGHAKQVGFAAASCDAAANMGEFTIVVDDDIDITDIQDVLWALAMRCDVEKDMQVIRGIRASMLRPRVTHQVVKEKMPAVGPKLVFDACKPFDWKQEFPAVNIFSPQYRQEIAKKWNIKKEQ